MRHEIEEDFRKLKDFLGINNYKSAKYIVNSFIIMFQYKKEVMQIQKLLNRRLAKVGLEMEK